MKQSADSVTGHVVIGSTSASVCRVATVEAVPPLDVAEAEVLPDAVGVADDADTPAAALPSETEGTLITTVTGDAGVFAAGATGAGVAPAEAGGVEAAAGVPAEAVDDAADPVGAAVGGVAGVAGVAAGAPVVAVGVPAVGQTPTRYRASHAGIGYGSCAGANNLFKKPSGSGALYGPLPHAGVVADAATNAPVGVITGYG